MLVAETDAQLEEANLRLSRVGIEDIQGYLAGGVLAWNKAGRPLATTAQISAEELELKLREGSVPFTVRAATAASLLVACSSEPDIAM